MRGPRTLVALLALGLLVGCSGSDSVNPISPNVSGPPQGACSAKPRLPSPAWLPRDLPLPQGTYFTQRLEPSSGAFRGFFVVPLSADQLGRFVHDKWPAAGYRLKGAGGEQGELGYEFSKDKATGLFRAQDMFCHKPFSLLLILYAPHGLHAS